MATHAIGGRKRSRVSAALVGLALALAVLVLATQASSIWTTRTSPHVQPVVNASLNPRHIANAGHLPVGCRPKYGCQHVGTGGLGGGHP
jgi:hypothetical protein